MTTTTEKIGKASLRQARDIAAVAGRQKLQINLSDGSRVLASMPLDPATQIRLLVYADANNRNLIEMIDLGLRFAVAPDDQDVDLSAPDDNDILDYAARLLLK